MYTTEDFFDIEEFAHKALFEMSDRVWEPLALLVAYLQKQALGTISCPVPEGVHLIHPELIKIGDGTVLEPGAYIRGPCILGENCQVRHGAYIRGNVIVGDRCMIGHATEVKHSILLDDAHAAHLNYVGDSILGNGVNLGAGVKLANFRLDQRSVPLIYEGKKVETGLKKLGAIIGDGTQIGCNAVINPGTVIGRRSLCRPNSVIGPTHLKSTGRTYAH